MPAYRQPTHRPSGRAPRLSPHGTGGWIRPIVALLLLGLVLGGIAWLLLPSLGAARRTARQMQQNTEQRMREQQRLLDQRQQAQNAPQVGRATLDAAAMKQRPVRSVAEAEPRPHLPGRYDDDFNTEAYDRIVENPFRRVADRPLSTFSADVDTASYANIRRFLQRESQLPPKDAVRIEEMINYFDYAYTAPAGNIENGEAPFAAHMEIAGCPWQPEHRLLRIGLKGWQPPQGERPDANLVFLLDVSGSMNSPHKLPLLKQAFSRLTNELRANDRVAIAVYAGASGLVLDSTAATNKQKILDALRDLRAGGSTNGGEGIKLAYKIAQQNFIEDGINRVILATDGDFNVGITNRGDLTRLIEDKARTGTYLSVLGFGTGNVKDATMEELSNKGDGNYAYIDSVREAEKVLVRQAAGTLTTIAKDVKLQLEFNPNQVQSYRLIGYENRMLAKEDFNDDTKDAGDIGAGHTVTALYEIVPANGAKPTASRRGRPSVDELKYQTPGEPTDAAQSNEMLTLKLRYKAPDAKKVQGTSKLIEFPVSDAGKPFANASRDFQFAASVAAFGMLLRGSENKGNATFGAVREWAQPALGEDAHGYRAQFLALVQQAQQFANGRG